MNIEKVPVSQLLPAKYNPRKDLKPGDPAYEKIKRRLHDFGYVDPIVWNEVWSRSFGIGAPALLSAATSGSKCCSILDTPK